MLSIYVASKTNTLSFPFGKLAFSLNIIDVLTDVLLYCLRFLSIMIKLVYVTEQIPITVVKDSES